MASSIVRHVFELRLYAITSTMCSIVERGSSISVLISVCWLRLVEYICSITIEFWSSEFQPLKTHTHTHIFAIYHQPDWFAWLPTSEYRAHNIFECLVGGRIFLHEVLIARISYWLGIENDRQFPTNKVHHRQFINIELYFLYQYRFVNGVVRQASRDLSRLVSASSRSCS